jgi:voltage-gated potassium channel
MPRTKKPEDAMSLLVNSQSAMIGIGILTVSIIVGTILFHLIEGWDIFHSLYYVSMTMSTIGFGDIVAATHAGKTLTIIYALAGVPLFIYAASLLIEARIRSFVVGHLHHHQQEINRLKAENRKENKAIAEVSENIEDVSENMEDVSENMEEIMQAFEKAHSALKRRQGRGTK